MGDKLFEGENPNSITIKETERAIEILSDIVSKAKERETSYTFMLKKREIRILHKALTVAHKLYMYSWNFTDTERDELKEIKEIFGEVA